MSFQENLRYYREKAGYTPTEMSKFLSVAYNTYVGYEIRGREPKYNTLCKIADLLNVTTDELLGRENNILGKNEDERLKKEICNALSDFKPTLIELLDITDKHITFLISDNTGSICKATCDKSKFIDNINGITHNFNQYRKERLYSFSITDSIENSIHDIDKQLDTIKKEKALSIERKKTLSSSIENQLNLKYRLIELKNKWIRIVNMPKTFIHREISIYPKQEK